MFFFQKKWKSVIAAADEVDLTFLLLRFFSLIGGIAWLFIVPLPGREKSILINALIFFAIYSLVCYLIIFLRPGIIRKVYLASLFLDMVFLSNLIHTETSFVSSFFLGYYLLICLHTIYFGLRFGLLVAFFSAICYGFSIIPLQTHIEWTDLAMRIGFLFFIAVPVGLLTEKEIHDRKKVEHFNTTLESLVDQRMEKIRALLDQERYLQEILNTVAHINKLLITSPDIASLVENTCARFAQHGHYGFSWIGLLQDDKINAGYTSDKKGVPRIDSPLAVNDTANVFYRSTAAQCVRDNQAVIHRNAPGSPDAPPWRDPDIIRGFSYAISLPLRVHPSAPPLGVLTIYTWRKAGFDPKEKDMLDELAGDISFAINSLRQKEAVTKLTAERSANFEETIFSFVDMIEQRDTYTAGHSERVAHYCQLIAREMDLEFEQTKTLYKAAILHDIGKIATPDSVLLKPGKLTELDYDLIKLHASAGHEMLSKIEMYKDMALVILHHHEKHDGQGYPDGLRGNEIPRLSQIMAVSDAFDAMTTNRIYKARKKIPEAIEELQAFSGSQFNPEVVIKALKVLAQVEISPTISQMPTTELEKKRFSYFFNDKLTGLYNEDYLKTILNNLDINQYNCLHMLHLQNVPEYNKLHGWSNGNEMLKAFATDLQSDFPKALIFRAYGNDFAILDKKHCSIDDKSFNAYKSIINTVIKIESHHVDLSLEKSYTIDKIEKLELRSTSA